MDHIRPYVRFKENTVSKSDAGRRLTWVINIPRLEGKPHRRYIDYVDHI